MSDRFHITNDSKRRTLADRSRKADTFFTRAIGLMGRRGLEDGEALIIQPCNGVVCFFMRFAIDVLFVDGEDRIVHMIPDMKPWRASSIVRASRLVVELPAGTIEDTGTEVGDTIAISPA